MTDYVYYVRGLSYGESYRIGGYMVCPRADCAAILGVAQEQIDHVGNPCSVAHVGHKYRPIAEGIGPRLHCGAHFVTLDPEERRSSDEWPKDLAWFLHDHGVNGALPHVFRRPIVWHGDM